MRRIHADGLTLEPQVTAHAEAMFVVLGDPAIYEYENAPPKSIGAMTERFLKLETRLSADGREKWLNWVIRLPTTELIGYVQATVHSDGRAAVAYVLSSNYWGRGLAQQAMRMMIGELAENYGVRRVTAVFKRDNRRSMRLLERLGFTRVSPGLSATHSIEHDEYLMHRDCALPG